ncbi:hypothetical protein GBAR_LOCUS5645 [Geodia barretti]|uniref:Uncharacterized protein n=1 Tax=Geodia barretti TaxID=519541 RepID=A0AA35W8Q4_GEOBA|nr:hypothetical protein GBAR_LOCUS5645 [Geodia barretti]
MCKITVFANDSVRFLTAPDTVEYVQDNRFRERLGAVRKPHLPALEDP